jgi:hypothetical protein
MPRPFPAILLALLVAVGASCGSPPAQPVAPAAPAPRSATGVAADAAFLARCQAAAEYSRNHDGEVMLVLLDGKPVFEDAIGNFLAAQHRAIVQPAFIDGLKARSKPQG